VNFKLFGSRVLKKGKQWRKLKAMVNQPQNPLLTCQRHLRHATPASGASTPVRPLQLRPLLFVHDNKYRH